MQGKIITVVVALAMFLVFQGNSWAKGHKTNRILLRFYCIYENPQSNACKELKQLRMNYRAKFKQAVQKIRTEVKNYCKEHPKKEFCTIVNKQKTKKMHKNKSGY